MGISSSSPSPSFRSRSQPAASSSRAHNTILETASDVASRQSARSSGSMNKSNNNSVVADRIRQLESSKLKNIVKSRGYSLVRKGGGGGSSSKGSKNSSKGSSGMKSSGMVPTPRSLDEMEYSSLSSRQYNQKVLGLSSNSSNSAEESITMRASQCNSKDAVGAAAMAVEYGVGEDCFIGTVDGITVDNAEDDDDNVESNEDEKVDNAADENNGVDDENNGKDVVVENVDGDQEENNVKDGEKGTQQSTNNNKPTSATTANQRPRIRQLSDWEQDETYDTGKTTLEYDEWTRVVDDEQQQAKGNNSNASIPPSEQHKPISSYSNTTTSKSTPPTSKSCNDLSSLQILGQTVSAVTAALNSGSVPQGELGAGGKEQRFKLSGVKFNRIGCVWDATLHVVVGSSSSSSREALFKFPIRATLCTEQPGTNYGDSNGAAYSIELSLANLPKGSVDAFWSNSRSYEIVAAMEWVHSKMRRSIKRGLARSVRSESLPQVMVRLPEREKVDHSNVKTANVKGDDANSRQWNDKEKAKKEEPSETVAKTKPDSKANGEQEKLQWVMDVQHVPLGPPAPHPSDNDMPIVQKPSKEPLPPVLPDLTETSMSLEEGPSFVPKSGGLPSVSPRKLKLMPPPSMQKSAQENYYSPTGKSKQSALDTSVLTVDRTLQTASTVNAMTESDSSSSTNDKGDVKVVTEPSGNHQMIDKMDSMDELAVSPPDKRRYGSNDIMDESPTAADTEEIVPAKVIENMRRGSVSSTYSAGDIRMAKRGLISQNSMKRLSSDTLSDDSEEEEIEPSPPQDEKKKKQRAPSANQLRLASMGLMSKKSMRSLGESLQSFSSDDGTSSQDSEQEEADEVVPSSAEKKVMNRKVLVPKDSMDDYAISPTGGNHDSDKSDDTEVKVPSAVIQNMKRGSLGSYSAGEIRMAKRGLMSQKSMRRLSMADSSAPNNLVASMNAGEDDEDDDGSCDVMDLVRQDSVDEPAPGPNRRGSLASFSEEEIRQARMSLINQRSFRGSSREFSDIDWDDDGENGAKENSCPIADDERQTRLKKILMGRSISDGMRKEGRPEGEIRLARRGLMSQKTMIHMDELRNRRPSEESDVSMDFGDISTTASFTDKDIEKAKMGLLSGKSMAALGINKEDLFGDNKVDFGGGGSSNRNNNDGKQEAGLPPPGLYRENSMSLEDIKAPRLTQKQLEQAKNGLISGESLARMGISKDDLDNALQEQVKSKKEGQTMPRSISSVMTQQHYPEGEIRKAKMGIISRKTELNLQKMGGGQGGSFRKGRARNKLRVSFSGGSDNSLAKEREAEEPERAKSMGNILGDASPLVKADKKAKEDDEDSDLDSLIFSDHELTRPSEDILTEGQYFLGISMLVYMYSHLRETCRMGHTRVKMEDIDVHSLQSQYKAGKTRKYLKSTKSAGSIIRVVIDELDGQDDDDIEHDIVGDENKEYEKSITAQFRTWIEDSRVNQLDKETEKMIVEMKRKVARHRWRRAISAVRLSYRLSGGKRPKFENPVVAPGCENQNRFVDMNAMVSEAMRTQPKFFREGSVMHNLIESGIELVWFSDMSQNDVVYGICVQREEKKVTVVFRGTVNAHNWKMNLKFDTNEYRNPVKQNYPGRVDELSLHSGFALYLLRKRKDTGISKLQEIFDKIDSIGREMAPDGNYKLCITGHSLGGALATLCGFYVAARSCFAHLPTIYIWTFAAPRVGTNAFIHAYQHLERTGRIRHARFSVTQDLVPLVPFCNFEVDDLQFYKHVGMRVQLHGVGAIGKWRLQRNLDVTYPLRHDWPSEIRRVFMNNIFANLTTLSGVKNNHKLTEYQKRLHFAMTYRKALGSGVLFSDKRRNRIKSLDEYYHIRAKITSASIAQEILEQEKLQVGQKNPSRSWRILFVVLLLLMTWLYLLISISTDIFERHPLTVKSILSPFAMVASTIFHIIHLPVAIPMAIYGTASSQVGKIMNALILPTHDMRRTAFVTRRGVAPVHNLINDLAVVRVNDHMAFQHRNAFFGARHFMINEDSVKLKIFDSTSKGLFNLAALIDDGSNPQLTISISNDDDQSNLMEPDTISQGQHAPEAESNEPDSNNMKQSEKIAAELVAFESRLKHIQEYATGVTFEPKLEEGLYLIGAGVRKKSILKLYAVAMYSSAAVLDAVSKATLRNAARTFNPSTPTTTFILEMVYSVGAEKIAGAIADSVKPRYGGSPSDINAMEALIVEGLTKIGGQATKGTVFRFDCSEEGVGVSVDGTEQGTAVFDGLGSAFVDVFLDDNAVSPTLVDSCIENWSSSESKDLSSSLARLTSLLAAEHRSSENEKPDEPAEDEKDTDVTRKAIESRMKSLQDYATSVTFDPKIDEDLYLIGVGVRKKSIISVYAVSMYLSAAVIEEISHLPRGNNQKKDASRKLQMVARSFGSATPVTTFVLEMVYSVGAEKIAGAIAESVKPRYGGAPSDVNALESLIIDGVNKIGGKATKGTLFRFDCSEEGVGVSVNGMLQGMANFEGMGSAFVDVFMDDNAVSTTLVDSCLDTWPGVSI